MAEIEELSIEGSLTEKERQIEDKINELVSASNKMSEKMEKMEKRLGMDQPRKVKLG